MSSKPHNISAAHWVQLNDALWTKFKITLALRHETASDVLHKAIQDYVNKHCTTVLEYWHTDVNK